MIDKENNNKLYEKYKNMTYEELVKTEEDNHLTENETIILTITKFEKELEKGKVEGIPAEEVFRELLGEKEYKKVNI